MAGRNYGTDPYGIISRGDPSARGGSSVSVGRVGSSVRDYSSPSRSFGSGVGATLSLPMKTKSKAKGGAIKKSGCEVKAYGDMIKKAAGGKVQTSSDTARKLATEMGGMKKGGVQKKAVGGPAQLSVKQPVAVKPPVTMKGPPSAKTIANTLRGKAKPVAQATDPRRPMPLPVRPTPVKPPVRPTPTPPIRPGRPTPMPVKPPVVAKPMTDKDPGWDSYRKLLYLDKQRRAQGMLGLFGQKAKDPRMMAAGGAGKTRKGQAPIKKMNGGPIEPNYEASKLAKGGAGKVRKGMMSPQGSILQAVKPKKGLGGM